MDSYYSHLSDEALFQKMSQGDNQAQSILIHRYEFAGIQCFNTLIKQHNLYQYKATDFIDEIDEIIFKSFKYYRMNERRFRPYCYDLLNQRIAEKLNDLINEEMLANETVYLDAPLSSDETTTYHDIIEDTYRLSAPKEYEMKEFVDSLMRRCDEKTRKAIELYKLHLYGHSVDEIAKMTNTTIYKVRKAVAEIDTLFEEKKKKYKLN